MTSIMDTANATTYSHRVQGGAFHVTGSYGTCMGGWEYLLRNDANGIEMRVTERTLRIDFTAVR